MSKDLERTLEDAKDYIDKISDAIVNKKLILFIGAGVSMNVGMKGWGQFLNEVKEEFKNHEEKYQINVGGLYCSDYKSLINALDKNTNNYIEAAQSIKKILDGNTVSKSTTLKDAFFSKVNNAFETNENLVKSSPIYKSIRRLYELGANKIITTNYDKNIEIILDTSELKFNKANVFIPVDSWIKSGGKFTDNNKFFDIRKGGSFLYKIHGEECPVMALNDYEDLYNEVKNNKFTELLKDLFNNHIVLFLGCSLVMDKTLEVYKKCEYTEAFTIAVNEIDSRNKLLSDRITTIELKSSRKKKTNNEIYKEQFDKVLKEIISKTEQKYKEQSNKVLYNDIEYDFDSARSFFNETMNASQCVFFNTQVDFKNWFTPAMQIHLSLQKAAFRSKKLDCISQCYIKDGKQSQMEACRQTIPMQTQARILFIPRTISDFKKDLKENRILRLNVESLVNIHSLTSCSLCFIGLEQFTEIIIAQKDFFKKSINLKFLGLYTLQENVSYLNSADDDESRLQIQGFLKTDIERQNNRGFYQSDDLDFAYLKISDVSETWEADVFGHNKLTYYQSLEIKKFKKDYKLNEQKRVECLKNFSKIILDYTIQTTKRKDKIKNIDNLENNIAEKMNPQFFLYEKLKGNIVHINGKDILEMDEEFFKKEFEAIEIINS